MGQRGRVVDLFAAQHPELAANKQDRHQPFRAPSDELYDNGECTAEFGAFPPAGKEKASSVRTCEDEEIIDDFKHPSVLGLSSMIKA